MAISVDNTWNISCSSPVNTLQLFITNQCNKRCDGCFYSHKLGSKHMSFDTYKDNILAYKDQIEKIILMGGEPTLHPDLCDMVRFNNDQGVKTTVYSNGFNLNVFKRAQLSMLTVRVGILGLDKGEKTLKEVDPDYPFSVVYMLRQNNVNQLLDTAQYAEQNSCENFYISSIRDIEDTGDFWKDNSKTISNIEYIKIVEDFLKKYSGNMRIHVAGRGMVDIDPNCNTCRFLNIFPDDDKVIICPLDISKKLLIDRKDFLGFRKRKCNKHPQCLLQKIVLEKIK